MPTVVIALGLDSADVVPSLWMAPCEPLAKLAQLDLAQFRSGAIAGRNAALEITRATWVGWLISGLVGGLASCPRGVLCLACWYC